MVYVVIEGLTNNFTTKFLASKENEDLIQYYKENYDEVKSVAVMDAYKSEFGEPNEDTL